MGSEIVYLFFLRGLRESLKSLKISLDAKQAGFLLITIRLFKKELEFI
jgi:hypothetical protein